MSERVDALDGWRALSALTVVTAHLQQFSSIRVPIPLLAGDYGVIGVQFFFGISGFVICRRFVRDGGVNFRAFYLRRCFRIIPPLALYALGVVALAHYSVIEKGAAGAVRGLTFTCNFTKSGCGGWFG